MNLAQTDIIDAVDARGRVVASLDGSDPRKAAREFAHAWEGGLIERIHDGQGPTMTRDELKAISGHWWKSQDGIRFQRRYYEGSKRVYPEGDRGVPHTTLAQHVERAVDAFSNRAWERGLRRIEDETKQLEAEIGVTDAKRYADGLAEVQALDAKNQLKSAITNMSDPVAKATMKQKYPELFSRDALSALAQQRSHAKHAGKRSS